MLHRAIEDCDIERVDSVLSKCDVHTVDEKGRTALYVACEKGYVGIARLLLHRGADINRQRSDGLRSRLGYTALHIAARRGPVDAAKLLLMAGADVNLSRTALHLSCRRRHPEVAGLLVRKGACVRAALSSGKYKGFTALHYAAWKGLVDTVPLLLNSGADVDAASWHGLKPLHYACYQGFPDIAERLLEGGAHVNAALNRRYVHGEAYFARGCTPLHCAAMQRCQVKLLELLLEWGADVNAEDDHLDTALSTACRRPIEEYWDSDEDDWDVVQVFAKHLAKMQASRNMIIRPANLEVLCRDEETSDFWSKCQTEIEAMSNRAIAGSMVRFFDLLTNGTRTSADYLKNNSVAKELESGRFETEFPIYASHIRYKTSQARERRDLQRQSDFVLRQSRLRCLPSLCIQRINSYLTNEDLGNIIRAKPARSHWFLRMLCCFKPRGLNQQH